jgi:2-polyprenyl-3-methyl-5-hydroxy-6-metoxy-1,4-benzoquinol methylase
MKINLIQMIRQRRDRENIYSSAAYWDAKAESYEDTAVSMWPNRALNQLYDSEQKNLITRHVGDITGLVMIDLGCGTGRFSRWLASRGAIVTGADFSAGALDIAKRQSSSVNPTYRQCSIFELTDQNVYDMAFVWGVLTVACRDKDQLRAALTRIRNALHINGRILLNEPIHSGFLHRVLNLNLTEFLAVLREVGFEITVTKPLHFWPMRLFLAYVPWPKFMTVPLYHLGQLIMRIPGLNTMGDYQAIYAIRRQ